MIDKGGSHKKAKISKIHYSRVRLFNSETSWFTRFTKCALTNLIQHSNMHIFKQYLLS